ncbi:2Fe-2S iron-sulfur cluster-binding protein [Amycolatopsis jejuensis]|uniref:2Fe-2S iron-sulfur cluster-binding protein n=1 Tax=Amycolatopsis jejuensis TaxID=330084 RepID=UPI0006904EAE|nr:2Fe-2S iron-sulfur cluster-binding protein [Amycolatopsis jejuensis]
MRENQQLLPAPMTSEQVEAVIGTPSSLIKLKQLTRLDDGSKDLLSRAPIAGIGYLDRNDEPVSTFVGGTEGFATIVDDEGISIPMPAEAAPPKDATGIGLVFLFPGVGEVLRLNGRVTSAESGKIDIAIEEVYIHCSRAISRAGLWELPASGVRAIDHSAESPAPGPLDDPQLARVMANSPFLVLSSFGPSGSADTSPRGDASGFVHRLDGRTLAIPDRKGNQRADTFHNLAHDPRISFAALVPGTSEVAIVSGTGAMTTDAELLETMAINGAAPQAALLVEVQNARVVSPHPIDDAELWNPKSRAAADQVPDMNALASRQIARNAKGKSAISVLLNVLNAIPGLMSFLTKFGLNQALTKEGYGTHGPEKATKRQARIAAIRPESDDVVSVYLKAPDRKGFDFEPGQFFTVAVKVGDRTVRRAYSASQESGKVLRLSIKRKGTVSTHFHEQARRGDVVELTGPSGDFTPLKPAAKGDLVLIGGGSGITPLYSTLSSALRSRSGPRIVLIYGSRTEKDLVFRRSLDRLARKHPGRLTVRYLLTQPPPGWTGESGRIGPDTLPSILASAGIGPDASFWICGPDGLMDSARTTLLDLGVPKSSIHEERFARAATSGPQIPLPVTVKRGEENLGVVTVGEDETILDAALAAGLPMKYSCTVGECGECAVRLRGGKVALGTPNCLTPSDLADNVVLTCVGRPTEPTTIDIDYALSVGNATGTGFETWGRQA